MFGLKKKNKKLTEKERMIMMQREADLKRENEMRAKFQVKKQLSDMKNELNKLEKAKDECIEKAKKAMMEGDTHTCNFAKQALKRCLVGKKRLSTMISICEMHIQTNEMQKVLSGVSSSLQIIANEMKSIAPEVDIAKTQMAFEDSLRVSGEQFQTIDELMGLAEDSLKSFDSSSDTELDAEIDKLINDEVAGSEAKADREMDKEIEEKLKRMKKELEE